jgi:hypothetical protein
VGANLVPSRFESGFIEPRPGTCDTWVEIKTGQQFMYHVCRTSKLDEHASDELQVEQQGPNFVMLASCNCSTIM